jgi:iron complex outermembrane receptor protein
VTTKKLRGGSLRTIVDPFPGLTITSITGYVDYRFRTSHYDGDGTSQDIFTVFRDEHSDTFSEEVIGSFTRGGLEWLAGIYYLKDRWTQTNDAFVDALGVASAAGTAALEQIVPGADSLVLAGAENANIENDNRERSQSRSAFTDVTYSLRDWLRVYAGGRYMKEEKEHLLWSRTTVLTPAGPVSNPACDPSRQRFDVGTGTGRVGLQVDVLADVMTYAQFATGFKPGGFAIATCGDSFEAEKVRAVELGWKSQWFDDRLRLNGAAFYYEYPNLQVEEVRFPEIEVNNADAEVRGVEFELDGLLLDWLEASVNGTWLDAFYTHFVNSDNAASLTGGPERNLAGNVLNRSPHFSGAAALEARSRFARFGTLLVRGETSFSTRYALREFNDPTDFQKAYAIGNFFVTWHSPAERLLLRAYVKNVADEPLLQGLLGIAGYKAASFGMPRTAGVEAGLRW